LSLQYFSTSPEITVPSAKVKLPWVCRTLSLQRAET